MLALGRLMYSDSLISELVYLECGEVTNGAKNIIISEPAALRAGRDRTLLMKFEQADRL